MERVAGSRATIARTVAIVAFTFALLAVGIGPAAARKPGAPAGSTIALEAYSDLRLGGWVGFHTTAAGLSGNEYPMVSLSCYQGSALVYVDLGHPDAEFLLGGSSSGWKDNGGGARCDAELDAYGWKGGRESVRTLATTSFDAGA